MKKIAFLLLTALLLATALRPRVVRADAGKRTKVIDFESSTVEGINRRPYDSLNQLSEADKRRKASHLYRKRTGFTTDTRETLAEMRFTQ